MTPTHRIALGAFGPVLLEPEQNDIVRLFRETRSEHGVVLRQPRLRDRQPGDHVLGGGRIPPRVGQEHTVLLAVDLDRAQLLRRRQVGHRREHFTRAAPTTGLDRLRGRSEEEFGSRLAPPRCAQGARGLGLDGPVDCRPLHEGRCAGNIVDKVPEAPRHLRRETIDQFSLHGARRDRIRFAGVHLERHGRLRRGLHSPPRCTDDHGNRQTIVNRDRRRADDTAKSQHNADDAGRNREPGNRRHDPVGELEPLPPAETVRPGPVRSGQQQVVLRGHGGRSGGRNGRPGGASVLGHRHFGQEQFLEGGVVQRVAGAQCLVHPAMDDAHPRIDVLRGGRAELEFLKKRGPRRDAHPLQQ